MKLRAMSAAARMPPRKTFRLISILFAACARAAAQEMCGSPLPDWLLPSEENYQRLHMSGVKSGDIYDRLHTIPLGSEGTHRYLAIGGQEREWYESFSTPPFGNGAPDENGYLLQRYMLHLDSDLGRARIFVELKGDLQNGRVGGPRPDIDEDRGDLHQAFVEFNLKQNKKSKLALRVGRQEFFLGSGRLVDIREGPNVRRSFDGVKVTYCSGNLRVDAFAARPVENRLAAFDDVPAHETTFGGIYGSRKVSWFSRSNVDVYYFAFDQKQSHFVRATAHEQRHTIGGRIWQAGTRWDYDLELVNQFGRFGPGGIEAWGISLNTGYTFSTTWQPRLGFKTGIASGDSGVSANDLGTFNPLFASLHYFGEEGLAGPANFTETHPEFEMHPQKNVRVLLSSNWFWRHRVTDGVYLPGPILLVPPNGSRARYVGNLSAVEIEWDPSPHWTTATYWSHFTDGQFLQEATKTQNLNYVAGWITFHF